MSGVDGLPELPRPRFLEPRVRRICYPPHDGRRRWPSAAGYFMQRMVGHGGFRIPLEREVVEWHTPIALWL